MGENIEKDTRFAYMAAIGNGVRFTCSDCKEVQTRSGVELVERFGANASLGMVGPFLRCPKCRSAKLGTFIVGTSQDYHPPSTTEPRTMADKWNEEVREIVLRLRRMG